MKRIISLGILTLFVSCMSTKTNDAEEAFRYWSGSKSPKEIKLIKGEYYQSGHFTLEYELFLKFKTNKKWFKEFVRQNNLEIDTTGNNWSRFTELPNWFKTNDDYIIYAKDQHDDFERSRYFLNPKNGICYIYETVGM